jgi:hypothetical protein
MTEATCRFETNASTDNMSATTKQTTSPGPKTSLSMAGSFVARPARTVTYPTSPIATVDVQQMTAWCDAHRFLDRRSQDHAESGKLARVSDLAAVIRKGMFDGPR